MTAKELDGRVVIVTGASRGIGKGLALGYADAGAAVVCAARSARANPSALPGTIEATVDEITAAGGQAIAVRCDIGVDADLEALVERTIEEFGRVDSLMNNAMAPTQAVFDASTVDEWDESMRINVRGLFLLTKLVEPHMTAQGGGSIINMSSHGADHAVTQFMPPGYL